MATTQTPLEWLKTYATTHLFYIVLIVGGILSFRVWLGEHDARVAAENAMNQSQAQIVTLQKQIKDNDTVAAQKVQTIVKVVQAAKTPEQIVQAIPQLTDLPLNTRTIPGDPVDVEVNAQQFVTVLGDLKIAQTNLGACQADLIAEKIIDAQKDTQIATLKKKPKFLSRVKHVAEAVGVGIAIGFVLTK